MEIFRKCRKIVHFTYNLLSFTLLLVFVGMYYITFVKNQDFILIYLLIIFFILISFSFLLPSSYFSSRFKDLDFKYHKIYIILFCGQLIEILSYIVLFIEYFWDCINDNLIYYIILGIILFRIIQILFLYYIKNKESKFSLNKWFSGDYEGYGFYLNQELNSIISKDKLYQNHYTLRNIEKRILNKFKTNENLIREKFLISKKVYFFEKIKLISIASVLIGNVITILSIVVTLIIATYKENTIKFFEDKFKYFITSEYTLLLFMIAIYIIFINYINYTYYKTKKIYLKILDYVIENYDVLSEKHNIKRLCLQDEFYNKYYLTTIFIEYSNLLIQQEKIKEVLKFLEENGIQIIFCSNEIKRKDIEKSLKNFNLFSYDYTILDKKEIEKIKIENCIKDKEADNEIYQILSEKLGISSNEKFIISESEEEIKLEFVDFEDKYFSDLKEVLDFLQSKME